MQKEIQDRIDELLEEAAANLAILPDDYWVAEHQIPIFQKWISGCINLLKVITNEESHYFQEADRIQSDKELGQGVPTHLFRKAHGLLMAANEDLRKGFLAKVEYIIAAASFDDFLDHAAEYHKKKMKNEAAVLMSAVLEDTIKRVAKKVGVPHAGLTLDPLIDALVKKGVFSSVMAKRLKAYAGVRNASLHAEWEKFTLDDVGQAIDGTRQLIADSLDSPPSP